MAVKNKKHIVICVLLSLISNLSVAEAPKANKSSKQSQYSEFITIKNSCDSSALCVAENSYSGNRIICNTLSSGVCPSLSDCAAQMKNVEIHSLSGDETNSQLSDVKRAGKIQEELAAFSSLLYDQLKSESRYVPPKLSVSGFTAQENNIIEQYLQRNIELIQPHQIKDGKLPDAIYVSPVFTEMQLTPEKQKELDQLYAIHLNAALQGVPTEAYGVGKNVLKVTAGAATGVIIGWAVG